MTQVQTLEIAKFRAEPSKEFLAARAAAISALSRECSGLVSTRLVRYDDDVLADEFVWRSRDEAEAAAERAPSIPEAGRYFGLIAEVVSMDHAEIIAS